MGALYRVKSNLDINGRFWGLDFEHGEAVTNRDDLARRLKSLGYEVVEVAEQGNKGLRIEGESGKEMVVSPSTLKVEMPEAAVTVDETAQTAKTSESTSAETTAQPEVQTTADGKPVCPVCGKVCGSKAVLTRHMNKEHPQE